MPKKVIKRRTTKKPVLKPSAKIAPQKPEAPKHAPKKEKFVFGIGRRKTAIARIKLTGGGTGQFQVNKRDFKQYFPTFALQKIVMMPLETTGLMRKVDIVAQARGGGTAAQAQSVALAVSRALVKSDEALKLALKKLGLLTRDSRKKERKKPGLKRARRAPQWQKR